MFELPERRRWFVVNCHAHDSEFTRMKEKPKLFNGTSTKNLIITRSEPPLLGNEIFVRTTGQDNSLFVGKNFLDIVRVNPEQDKRKR